MEASGGAALERAGAWLFERLPEDVDRRLAPDVRQALSKAAAERAWNGHPVDIRMSVPLPFGRCYLALVAGRERREPDRRRAERRARALVTAGNVLFVLATVALFYGALAAAALVMTRIVE